MNTQHSFSFRLTATLVAAATFWLSAALPAAQARMIGTDTALSAQAQTGAREQVVRFLEREDVAQVLARQGVTPAEAQARVASLSDDEVNRIAGQIDTLPAGGSVAGALIGAALVVFIVLLITDILGFTHVYPFVNHRR